MSEPIKKVSARASSKRSKVVSLSAQMPAPSNVCASCHVLPVGSLDLTALMLVLVFSLTAVLFTSVYALNVEHAKVNQLESEIATLNGGV